MLESVWLRLQDKGGLLRRIAEHRAEREAALEQQRARREMAELADCTFRPTRVAAAAPPPPKVLPTFSPHPHQFHPSLLLSSIREANCSVDTNEYLICFTTWTRKPQSRNTSWASA